MLNQWYRTMRKRPAPLPDTRAWRMLRRYHEAAWRVGARPIDRWVAPDGTEYWYRDCDNGHQWLWKRCIARAGHAAGASLMRKTVADLARELRALTRAR